MSHLEALVMYDHAFILDTDERTLTDVSDELEKIVDAQEAKRFEEAKKKALPGTPLYTRENW